ncbi:MAG: N-acetylmuramoyl-L-alanine amidase [Negativicutes bacterium]|jgi:N-acetylmuramoyl-L-alanine amidase
MKICIDAGHTGVDPGAVGARGTHESDINLRIAQILRDKLEARGCSVIMTRALYYQPALDDLARRAEISNNYESDYFVSIHCNAATTTAAHGFEVYYFNGSRMGNILAGKICQQLDNQLVFANRGIKPADFQVLRETNCPAVLVECGFITNPDEEKFLLGILGQVAVAQAIADGLCEP